VSGRPGRIGSIALKLMLLIRDKVVDVEDAAIAAPGLLTTAINTPHRLRATINRWRTGCLRCDDDASSLSPRGRQCEEQTPLLSARSVHWLTDINGDLNSPVKLLLFPGSATHGRAPFWCQAGEMPTVPDKLHRLC
jgi:hypothetical protein